MTSSSLASGNESERDWLITFLAERDLPCPLCGYNLRRLASDRCPGCGRELRLSVGLAEPYVRAWVAAMVSTGAGAGAGAFVVAVLLREGWPPPRMWLVTISLYYFLASIPAMAVALLGRRAFMQLGRATQWAVAWTCAALLLAALATFCLGLKR